jgi:hypothetical protein
MVCALIWRSIPKHSLTGTSGVACRSRAASASGANVITAVDESGMPDRDICSAARLVAAAINELDRSGEGASVAAALLTAALEAIRGTDTGDNFGMH